MAFLEEASAPLAISSWSITELHSALGLKVRTKALSKAQAEMVLQGFARSLAPGLLVQELEPQDFHNANACLRGWSTSLRAPSNSCALLAMGPQTQKPMPQPSSTPASSRMEPAETTPQQGHTLQGQSPRLLADRSTDWLEQAFRDLEQAAESLQSGRHEWACFAAHQAVEKALKALNLALGQQAWGHTLSRLWAALPPQVWTPEPPADLEDRLRLLDGFYIPTRYPDSYPEGTPGEHFGRLQSEQALLHADAILHWAGAALAQVRAGDRSGDGLGEDPAAPEP